MFWWFMAAQLNLAVCLLLSLLLFHLQLFHGKFWSCNDTSVPDKAACTGTFMLDGGVVSYGPQSMWMWIVL